MTKEETVLEKPGELDAMSLLDILGGKALGRSPLIATVRGRWRKEGDRQSRQWHPDEYESFM